MGADRADISDRLARLIADSGPISVAHYMAEANAHYYGTRDPLGQKGDFTTAPEISQVFGELIGLWLADLWARAGRQQAASYVELGPGRGTLASDALRAMRAAGLEPAVHFVETSAVLRRAQSERVPKAQFHDELSTLTQEGPLLVVANEFFDALPVRQLVSTGSGWRELMVTCEDGRFERVAGSPAPAGLPVAPPGTIVETAPAAVAVTRELSRRTREQGGAALIIDYGHARHGSGDTLQALAGHAYADPWQQPGARDLTVHVDFEALQEAAAAAGGRPSRVVTQGEWLRAMGIDIRINALARSAPDRAVEMRTARDRLVSEDEMGSLFKVLAITSPEWPTPEGFA